MSQRVLAVLFVAASVGCGQLTGLSDDFTYDLEAGTPDGTAPSDAGKTDGGDGAAGDAAVDGGSDAGRCTAAQAAAATTTLGTLNGTTECKTCLATECCTEVTDCTAKQTCKASLTCDLECTTKSNTGQKAQCFNDCKGSADATFTPLQGCAQRACKTQCGF